MRPAASYSIADLAAAGGVSRRTVRFYVQLGVLPPPDGLGRGARYTDRHLARLLEIKAWQEQGVALEEIRARLLNGEQGRKQGPGGTSLPPSPRPSRLAADPLRGVGSVPGAGWFRQPLARGFELHVAADTRPLTASQLAALAGALADIIKNGGAEK